MKTVSFTERHVWLSSITLNPFCLCKKRAASPLTGGTGQTMQSDCKCQHSNYCVTPPSLLGADASYRIEWFTVEITIEYNYSAENGLYYMNWPWSNRVSIINSVRLSFYVYIHTRGYGCHNELYPVWSRYVLWPMLLTNKYKMYWSSLSTNTMNNGTVVGGLDTFTI
jgi:hypothetical protein